MASVSQELKKSLAPKIKEILKRYNVKGTLSVNNHSTLVLSIKSGAIDFLESAHRIALANPRYASQTPYEKPTYTSVNPYWYKEHFDGVALEFLKEMVPAMNVGNFDDSDIQSDYFSVGWYIDIDIGEWNKPYILTK